MKTNFEATTHKSFLEEIKRSEEKKFEEVLDSYVTDYIGSVLGVYEGDECYEEGDAEREESILGCKSPIERIMYLSIAANLKNYFNYGEDVFIKTQSQINAKGKNYYVDFKVCYFDGKNKPIEICVEVDGHKYHNESKEKVSKDRQRERAIRTRCNHLMVFTGSEVFNDYDECAMEVVTRLLELVNDNIR